MLPSSIAPTLSFSPISEVCASFPLNANADVRPATLSPPTFERTVVDSSAIPYAK